MIRRAQLFHLERRVAQDGRVDWHQVADIWVRMRVLRTRATVRLGDAQLLGTHMAHLRQLDAVQPGLRLRQKQRSFIIHRVEPMGRRVGWMSCLCEEINSLSGEPAAVSP